MELFNATHERLSLFRNGTANTLGGHILFDPLGQVIDHTATCTDGSDVILKAQQDKQSTGWAKISCASVQGRRCSALEVGSTYNLGRKRGLCHVSMGIIINTYYNRKHCAFTVAATVNCILLPTGSERFFALPVFQSRQVLRTNQHVLSEPSQEVLCTLRSWKVQSSLKLVPALNEMNSEHTWNSIFRISICFDLLLFFRLRDLVAAPTFPLLRMSLRSVNLSFIKWVFRTCPHRPCGPPVLLYNGHRVCFRGVKRQGCGVEVNERVHIYLYFPLCPSWPVLGRNLPSPFIIYLDLRMLALTSHSF
jgi:hypothetical protein